MFMEISIYIKVPNFKYHNNGLSYYLNPQFACQFVTIPMDVQLISNSINTRHPLWVSLIGFVTSDPS